MDFQNSQDNNQDYTKINFTQYIKSPSAVVWQLITNPQFMGKWLSDDKIHVESNWKNGSPIIFSGMMHGIYLYNKGIILQFTPLIFFKYNYISNLSNLPDVPENYTKICFTLNESNAGVILELEISEINSYVDYKHLEMYWKPTLNIIKKFAESELLLLNE